MDIAMLGPVELRADTGEPVPVAGARLRTLLILLALDAGRAVSTGRLADGVWGDDQPASAGNALQALVSRLRRAAPGLAVAATPAGYRLDLDRDRVDAHRFTRLVAEGRCEEALALWRGPTEFPDVARAEAVRLDELRLAARQDRIEARLRAGGGAELVPELEALVAAHPLHEPLASLLMRALVAAGHPGRALTVFEGIRAELADTLGADPSPELSALHVATLRGRQRRSRGNLPADVSSFIGREDDLRAVSELIDAHRLVTLIGPGGSGKTRLSVEAGQALADSRPDGVWQVELAPVTDPAEVPHTILTALNLRGQVLVARPGLGTVVSESVDPLTRLTEALAEQGTAAHPRQLRASHRRRGRGRRRHAPGRAGPAAAGDQPRAARHTRRAALARRAARRRAVGVAGRSATPPYGCCWTGRRPRGRGSGLIRTRPARWSGSVAPWTGCRSPSSLPRPGCVRCPSTCWPTGSPTGSGCSPAAAAPRSPGIRRCVRSSTGAGTCSATTSGRCGGGSRCSTAAPT
nr:hypothetical protein GCM10020092_087850 [Actinoplanes digitatis]